MTVIQVGKERDEFLNAITLMAGQVYDFHQRFGYAPNEIWMDLMEDRMGMTDEEINEVKVEIKEGNIDFAIHEAADILFVAIGTIEVFKTFGNKAILEVVAKNMGKTDKTHAAREDTGKIASLSKPRHWEGAEEQYKREREKRGMDANSSGDRQLK